jgi:predicted nucleotidyltransferase
MAKRPIKEVITFLNKCLSDTGLNISKIIIFGSYAYGKPTEESDIDIVIVSKDFEEKDIFERAELTKEAEIKTIKKFVIPLDIITMTPEEFKNGRSLISGYAKNGKVLYAA